MKSLFKIFGKNLESQSLQLDEATLKEIQAKTIISKLDSIDHISGNDLVFNPVDNSVSIVNPISKELDVIHRTAIVQKYQVTYSYASPFLTGQRVMFTKQFYYAYVEGSDILMKDLVRVAKEQILNGFPKEAIYLTDSLKIASIDRIYE